MRNIKSKCSDVVGYLPKGNYGSLSGDWVKANAPDMLPDKYVEKRVYRFEIILYERFLTF
jgi:hypothetical protein